MVVWTAEEVTRRLACLNNRQYFYTQTTDSPLKAEYSFVPILRHAAVLIPLYNHNDQLRVLLTIRSEKVRTYSGQVAFPGGMREDIDENPIDTALRETEEEIGLDKNLVTVVCCLKPVVSRTKVLIFPVVGFVANLHCLKLNVNKDEVDFYFSLPLDRFLNSDGHVTFPFEVTPGLSVSVHNFRNRLSVVDDDFGGDNCRMLTFDTNDDHELDLDEPSEGVKGQKTWRQVETFGLTAALCIFCAIVVHRRFVQYDFKDYAIDSTKTTEDNNSDSPNKIQIPATHFYKNDDVIKKDLDDKFCVNLYDAYFNGFLEKLKSLKKKNDNAAKID